MTTAGDALGYFLAGLCLGWGSLGVLGFLLFVYVVTQERPDDGEREG